MNFKLGDEVEILPKGLCCEFYANNGFDGLKFKIDKIDPGFNCSGEIIFSPKMVVESDMFGHYRPGRNICIEEKYLRLVRPRESLTYKRAIEILNAKL